MAQRVLIDPWYRLASTLGASATVGGLRHGAERPVRGPAWRRSLGVQVKLIRITCVVIMCAVTASTLGCTWVPLTDEGGNVRTLQANAAEDCQKISTVSSKTADRVVIFARSDRKVREELESLARNEAADAGGNAIVPIGTMTNGRQSFDVYRCQDR